MKVKVTKYLNVRVGKPSVNAPCYQYLAPGSELEVDEEFYPGDEYLGNSKWLRDNTGNYYWSGGVDKEPLEIMKKMTNSFPEWMLNLNIPEIWKYATGKGVGIAVVDTGIDIKNDQLPFNKKRYYVFDKNISLHDNRGHGTHCAGLIGARNTNGNFVGVAPNCNLFVCKISESNRLNSEELIRYANAINWCAEQTDIHVISISYGSMVHDNTILPVLQEAVNKAVSKGKILVCAMGNASRFNDSTQMYPVSLENTIGIGSVPVSKELYPYLTNNLTTMIEGVNIPSYGINGEIVNMTGTSQSNAIAAGIAALIIQKRNMAYDLVNIKNVLLGVSKFQNFNGIEFPVIDKYLLLEYFKL
jgi:subtilisin family serine protease